MPSLYKTTTEIRLIVKWVSILVGTILALYVVFNVGSVIKEIISPTPPPPPSVKFGKLPAIAFQASLEGSKYSYTLNTVTGKLPTFSDRAKVYKLSAPKPNLLAVERAREKVSTVGFSGPGLALSSTRYQWDESVTPFRRLIMDVLDFNFDITSFYFQDVDVKSAKRLPTEGQAIKIAKDVITNLSDFPLDVDEEKTKTTLYQISNAELVEASSFSNAHIVRVDFFQKNVDDLKMYYKDPLFSSMSLLVSGGKSQGQVVEAHYFHNIVTEISATYPIITAEVAWEMLKEGDAHIARYDGTDSNISIKNIEMGFYSDDKKQEYMLPIIVFEGEDNFYAYVSAISKDWIKTD